MHGPALPNDVSADGAVMTSRGILRGVVLVAAAAAATLVLYDNASAASGTVLARLAAPANDNHTLLPLAVPFVNGVYADIGGAGAAAVVYI